MISHMGLPIEVRLDMAQTFEPWGTRYYKKLVL